MKDIESGSGTAIPDSSTDDKKDEKEKKEKPPLATIGEVFSFAPTRRTRVCFGCGIACSFVTGSIYPAMAFFFSKVFEELSAPTSMDSFLDNITELAFTFVILGAIAFIFMTAQAAFLETAADEMTYSLKTRWFDALLRQDLAYYDIKDVSGNATIISSNASKYKKGVGRKLGEGVQFFITCIGCFGFAFYSSWQNSLLILALLPVIAGSTLFVVKATTNQTSNATKSYAEAGAVAYSTISSIRTVLSLNAGGTMLDKFRIATEKAYRQTSNSLFFVGLGNGLMMASFLLTHVVLTLFGAYLLYRQVKEDGCDPSGVVEGNDTCGPSARDVFGSLMGVMFASAGIPQISVAIEGITNARAACHPAVVVMQRCKTDNDDNLIENSDPFVDEYNESDKKGKLPRRSSMPLPKYVIDSSSQDGFKPSSTDGNIEFRNVKFSYPTRYETAIFKDFSLTVEAGKTVALVGPSGGGKSTTVQLIERFYDPQSGSITLDGIDLKQLNVHWLRDQIGLVSQEPALFASSIKENIAYGCPGIADDQIVQAAKMANAHDFISSFPDGYDTQVGEKGTQLSGGQKQRIAIARVLVKNPKILLLDEATSALDSESELVVQEALDKLLETGNRTTIVIAHRLSTIRNVDMIVVVLDGKVVETGSHEELLAIEGSKYGELVDAQRMKSSSNSLTSSRSDSDIDMYTRNSYDIDPQTLDTKTDQLIFRDVRFSYPTRPDIEVFKGLNLSVKRGETLALVGPSGGGKSTTIQLIERFYDPNSGTIDFEGVSMKELNVKFLRDQFGLVGQEPTLFNTTIAENIRYGCPSASQEDIEDAAKKSNAHDFIMSFPDGYDTDVGECGTQVSGGQKQRIAIARAILKKPKILLLDEATSALDSESERIVQMALDDLMAAHEQTTIVIAHRLSTIQNADRIAFIADGVVKEIGSHNELMAKPNGRYKRLQELQEFGQDDVSPRKTKLKSTKEEEEEEGPEDKDKLQENATTEVQDKELEKKHSTRARLLAKNDKKFFAIGVFGASLAGGIFPAWGIVSAYMIDLLFRPVLVCDDFDNPPPPNFSTCDQYWDNEANDMEQFSFEVTYGWLATIAASLIGNVLLFYGFGKASERMNRRVRDSAFESLIRQEVGYFDQHSIGSITTKLQDDTTMVQSFSGQPIRVFTLTLASVLLGLVISFAFMWPFALLTLAILPFMGFGAVMEMKMYLGEDEGDDVEKTHSGGVLVETLLNIRTVASLTIEQIKSDEYADALQAEQSGSLKTSLYKGMASGLGQLSQQWGMGLMFWWGGWLLVNQPGKFTFLDYNISMMSLLYALSGLGVAAQGVVDKDKANAAAERIFALIDRKSAIDPLSNEGKMSF